MTRIEKGLAIVACVLGALAIALRLITLAFAGPLAAALVAVAGGFALVAGVWWLCRWDERHS